MPSGISSASVTLAAGFTQRSLKAEAGVLLDTLVENVAGLVHVVELDDSPVHAREVLRGHRRDVSKNGIVTERCR